MKKNLRTQLELILKSVPTIGVGTPEENMRILLTMHIVFIIAFRSAAQSDFMQFEHNGYIFKTEIDRIIEYLKIETDSIKYYKDEFQKVNTNNLYHSDSSIQIGQYNIGFFELIRIFDTNHTFVEIRKADNDERINYKVKIVKKIYPSNGIGESSDTFLIIIDKKGRKEIVREVIRKAIAC